MLSSIKPISHIRDYLHTWNKQNSDVNQRIIQIANILVAITTGAFAVAGVYGTVKVITCVCTTIIGVVAHCRK